MSILIGIERRIGSTSLRARMARMRGTTRSSSSASVQGIELGRVDIPPISRMCGGKGTANIVRRDARTCGIERLVSAPSEKESGVALIIAIIRGVDCCVRIGVVGCGNGRRGAS